jgi:hypothetical protein
MKISRVFAVVLLLAVGTVAAFADAINDPQVIIHGAGGNAAACPVSGCTGVGLNFNFKIPASGSGTLFFTNNSGVNWTSLTLIEKGVPAADVKCHSSLFGSCKIETLKSGAVEILLSISGADNPNQGIKAGQNFAITFACVHGGCWPGGISIGGHANSMGTVPEPGTMALLATGIGALVSRRKKWKNRWNS